MTRDVFAVSGKGEMLVALWVMAQRSREFDAMTIRISKVLDERKLKLLAEYGDKAVAEIGMRYVYEELQDGVEEYAHFVSYEAIEEQYPWACNI